MELALEPRSPEQWLEAVRQQERRGELIAAFDTAERGLAEHPGDLALEHRAVLALARTGATEEAARRLSDYGLSEVVDEDVAALRARIAKDEALAQDGTGRRRGAARAAEMYGDIVAAGGGYYPAVNAATLWLIAGDTCRAEKLACTVLELLQASGDDSYYAAATAAEANLLLRRQIAAVEALAQAAARHDGDYGALATTRRQLRLICETLDLDPSPLAVLAGPGVVHFCGHRIASAGGERFAAERESAAAAAIAEVVAERTPGFAYGALAAGADILWAEALLAAGAELHVILPFSTAEFVRLSVSPCGEAWVTRFERCVEAAAAVRFATDDASIGDDVLFRYGSELAMGLALLRARYLDANAWQLALWDGRAGGQDAGTAVDVAIWGRTGRPVTVVSPAGHDRADAGAAMPSIPPPPP
ncbi:MAG: tetratricopeptide repeat-containing protein, partial [Solirubrobacteraceae bacterium]